MITVAVTSAFLSLFLTFCVGISLGILSDERWASPVALCIFLAVSLALSFSIAISAAHSVGLSVEASLIANLIAILAFIGIFIQTSWTNRKAQEIALRQNLDNQRTEIRVNFYRSVVSWSVDLFLAQSKLVAVNIKPDFYFDCISKNIPIGPIPPVTVEELESERRTLTKLITNGIGILESWRVVDPRIKVFQVALSVSLYDINKSFDDYHEAALWCLPLDDETASRWSMPSGFWLKKLKTRGNILRENCITLGAYVSDLKLELQNTTIGDLFENYNDDRRTPVENRFKVITLASSEELLSYFLNETPWAKFHREAQERSGASAG